MESTTRLPHMVSIKDGVSNLPRGPPSHDSNLSFLLQSFLLNSSSVYLPHMQTTDSHKQTHIMNTFRERERVLAGRYVENF